MNVYLPNSRLPSAYQEVEYIQSSGTQYINSGVNLTTNIGFEVDFNISNSIGSVGYAVLGGRYQGGDNELNLDTFNWSNGGVFAYGSTLINPKLVPNTRQQCSFKNLVFTDCDGITINVTSYTFNRTVPLYIFACVETINNTVVDKISMKLYSCKIYDGNTLVRDFVPCYRKSDGVIGMYDLVNNQFYTNSGTGTFSKGNDVIMTELKNAYIGEKPFELEKIFDFTTADLHGFTYRITGGSGLTIDTSDYWCTRANANYSNGVIYKSAGYSHCRQRMKANFNYSSGVGGMILGIGQYFVEDNKCGFGIGIIERTTVRIFKYGDVNNYSDYSLPSGWNANTDYYYDLIFDNGTLTAEIYDTSMNKIFSQTFSGLNSTIPHIGFCMFSGTTSQGAAYIKEYRLAYE